jgi:peptidyl-prolyl cis-trans isomerase D
MQLFRRLANTIWFKIILSFVALSFIFFGVSSFILSSPNAWVVKVGNTTIGLNNYNSILRSEKESILANNKSADVAEYVNSNNFKSSVISRLVNKIMIEKLSDDFRINADKKIILTAIAKDRSFKDENGKFDRKKFQNFLSKNSLNEEKYVNEISHEINATMILQSLALNAPINNFEIFERESFNQEKRYADFITLSAKNITLPKITDEEVKKFFEENKQNYNTSEMRKVEYIIFNKSDIMEKSLKISNQEALDEYNANKEKYSSPELRSFYNVTFENEKEANDFLKVFREFIAKNNSSKNLDKEFTLFAKDKFNKDAKLVNNVAKKDLMPDLSTAIFNLAANQISEVIQSSIGFHVFFLSKIEHAKPIAFDSIKKDIIENLMISRSQNLFEDRLRKIDDILLSSGSLQKISQELNLKNKIQGAIIDGEGKNLEGEKISAIKQLNNFSKHCFAIASKGSTSKILSADNGSFYVIKLEEILPARALSFEEAKKRVIVELKEKQRDEELAKAVKKIEKEIFANPSNVSQIAIKYHLKLEKNHEFSRFVSVDVKGKKVAYRNEFLQELFDLKNGQATKFYRVSANDFVIGVLNSINRNSITSDKFEDAKKNAINNSRDEIMQNYNNYLLKKYPVKVNEKILSTKGEVQ